VKAGDAIGAYSYQDLALNLYGHWCRQLSNIILLISNWGSVVLYLKIVIPEKGLKIIHSFYRQQNYWQHQ